MSNEKINIVSIRYLVNDDLMHQWGLLVYLLENSQTGIIAIPRYETKNIRPGIFEKEIETNATIETIRFVIELLMGLKNIGDFPELVSISIKD